jgi:hypothetical protein
MKSDFESQVKALLIVASKSRRPSTAPYAGLLDKACKETTTVEELAGIRAGEGLPERGGRPPSPRRGDAAMTSRWPRHSSATAPRSRDGRWPSSRSLREIRDDWSGHPIGSCSVTPHAASRTPSPGMTSRPAPSGPCEGR